MESCTCFCDELGIEVKALKGQLAFWMQRYNTQHDTLHGYEDEIARLRGLESGMFEAHDQHLKTGDYAKLGMDTQDILHRFERRRSGW